MANKWYQDSKGNTSSKRVIGAIFMFLGAGLLMTIGIISITQKIADPETALEVGKTLCITGGGLLGIGVIEFLGGKNK